MNLQRYDSLLEQARAVSSTESRLRKCQEELTELTLELFHYPHRDNLDKVAEEMADALLTQRGVMLELGIEEEVRVWLERKAVRLHRRILEGVDITS